MSAAAERLIRAAESTSLSDPARAVAATLAAAEATLALVEEQRTANLIAWAAAAFTAGLVPKASIIEAIENQLDPLHAGEEGEG